MKVKTEGKTIVFTFDGDVPSISFDAASAAPAMREYAEMHGWEQRLRDNAAIARKQKDGSIITVTEAMRHAAVKELTDHYACGATEWNLGGRTRATPQNPTILAIAAKRACTYVEAEAWLAETVLADLA